MCLGRLPVLLVILIKPNVNLTLVSYSTSDIRSHSFTARIKQKLYNTQTLDIQLLHSSSLL